MYDMPRGYAQQNAILYNLLLILGNQDLKLRQGEAAGTGTVP